MTQYQSAIASIAQDSHDEHGRRLTVGKIAERMGERESYLGPRVSPYNEQHTLPATKVVALTHATGNLALIRHFAESCGCVLIQLPKVSVEHADVMAHAGNVAREFGDVMAEAGKSLADGRVTRDEAMAFRKQVNELVTVAMTFAEAMDIKGGIAPPVTPSLRAVEGGR